MIIHDAKLREKINYKLEKYNESFFLNEDLNKIYDISLSDRNFIGKKLNVNLDELKYLENLKILSLQFFDINDEVISIINSLKNLKTLHIETSKISGDSVINIEGLQSLIIGYSEINGLKNFKIPSNLELILKQDSNLDFNILIEAKNLKKLQINNSKIVNFKEVLNMENLTSLNIDGSEVDSIECLNILEKQISVSHEEKYLPN